MREYHPPENNGIEILYEDQALLIVSKSSGLLSVPGRGTEKQDCLLSRLQEQYPEVLSVHRLDMDTSGIIVFARDTTTHRLLSKMFELRQISKVYQAIVSGCLEDSGVINYPLSADWPNRPRQKVDDEVGKEAITRWKVIGFNQENNTSRVELYPETGRSHQLRIHLFTMGYPILGDLLYFTNHSDKAAERLMLHASFLSFIHPISKLPIEVECSPDF